MQEVGSLVPRPVFHGSDGSGNGLGTRLVSGLVGLFTWLSNKHSLR